MTEAATDKPKAAVTQLHADLLGRTVQATITLPDGGYVSVQLTGVDGSKARAALKSALRDASAAL